MGVLYGRALVQPTTIDQEAREVDVVCATEKMVTRFGWEEDYDEMLVCEAGAIRMDRANQGLPLLDCHNAYTVHSQLGRTVKVWINESRQLCARVRFSSRPEVAGIFQDVVDGIVKGISVGYEIYKFEREERPNGARPIYRAIDWMPSELSLAPVPADIDSGIRAGQQQHPVEIVRKQTTNTTNMKKTRATETGKTMEYVVEGDPVKQGDIVTVDGVKGVALSDGEVGDTITLTLIEAEAAPAQSKRPRRPPPQLKMPPPQPRMLPKLRERPLPQLPPPLVVRNRPRTTASGRRRSNRWPVPPAFPPITRWRWSEPILPWSSAVPQSCDDWPSGARIAA